MINIRDENHQTLFITRTLRIFTVYGIHKLNFFFNSKQFIELIKVISHE